MFAGESTRCRGVDRWIAVAPARQPLAVEGQDADHPGIVLGDVDDVVVVDIEERDADQLDRPDRQQLAVLVEDLHPVVLAVGDQHPPAAVDPQPVRQVELARPVARLAPGLEIFHIGREFVHARVAVAVRHEIRAVGRDDDVGRQVERPAAMRDLLPRGRAVIVVRHAGIGARSRAPIVCSSLPSVVNLKNWP